MNTNKDITKIDIKSWLENPSDNVVDKTEQDLELFAKSLSIQTSDSLKSGILNQISALNTKRKLQGPIDIKQPPLIDEYSNLEDWLVATKDIHVPKNFEDIHLEPIFSNNKVEMFVAWVSKMVPEEVHEDLLESFLILEGSCTCHIKDQKGVSRIVKMQAGDFITMNTGETHDIIITSEKPTKAVLQWLKLAA